MFKRAAILAITVLPAIAFSSLTFEAADAETLIQPGPLRRCHGVHGAKTSIRRLICRTIFIPPAPRPPIGRPGRPPGIPGGGGGGAGGGGAPQGAAAPTSPANANCSCLTKDRLADGSVLFRDTCTNESAVMPAPGGQPKQ